MAVAGVEFVEVIRCCELRGEFWIEVGFEDRVRVDVAL